MPNINIQGNEIFSVCFGCDYVLGSSESYIIYFYKKEKKALEQYM